jgi:hypothetical protein
VNIAGFVNKRSLDRRAYWLSEIVSLSGKFGADSKRVENELAKEVSDEGSNALLDHL